MKVLLVNGSPRKKNTFSLLEKISDNLSEKGCQTQILSLGDHAIKPCTGCYLCVLKGIESCRLKDDVNLIWEKFLEADGIVLSSPVYALGVSGLFKNFIDRIAYNAHRPTMYNKPSIIVSTTAGMGTEKVIEQLKWFEIAGLKIVKSKGFLVHPSGEDRQTPKEKKQKDVREIADRLIQSMRNPKAKNPTLMQVIQFYGLKLNCMFAKDIYSADYEYFKDKSFYVSVPVNPVKKWFGEMVFAIGTAVLAKTIKL